MDLGAGSGSQSIPLAKLGFSVTAIDFSTKLLNELKQSAGNLNISVVEDNILNFQNYGKKNSELIVCMGDTITHFEHVNQVEELIANCYNENRLAAVVLGI